MNNEIEHSLFDMHVNFSRFEIFNNKLSRRIFEKLVGKIFECFFYFIRNVEKFVKMSKN